MNMTSHKATNCRHPFNAVQFSCNNLSFKSIENNEAELLSRECLNSMIAEQNIPVLAMFEQVADSEQYQPLPENRYIGIADIVNSKAAVESGQYKSVNFSGAAIISAVSNALGGDLPLYTFGGDGAHFVLRPEQKDVASKALLQVAEWVRRELGLIMRVGLVAVADIRKAGYDVRVAYWQASQAVKYALFSGGGLEWSEAEMKKGNISVAGEAPEGDPDLTGLSCQWGPVSSAQGKIISLIVKPGTGAKHPRFDHTVRELILMLKRAGAANPLSLTGPEVRWPIGSVDLQSKTRPRHGFPACQKASTWVMTLFYWALFKLAIPVQGFSPDTYRSEIAANADFQKFNDGLMMTMDCSLATIDNLKKCLVEAASQDILRYGLHIQDEALITCVVPSAFEKAHMHFIDGSGGGYAAAALQLEANEQRLNGWKNELSRL